jgi:FKBP-type peptidyl-prolyl cis-trans isomerase FkpA
MKRASLRNLVLLAGLFIVAMTACKKDEVYDPNPQFVKDTTAIRAYLTAHNLVATRDSSTGIYYNIITPGNGIDRVKNFGTTVDVFYKGSLMSDGSVFDSTTTTTRTFTYNNVIVGWQFGLTQITKGGKIKLYLPSYYAYGAQTMPGIPANAVLIFDIQLVDLHNPS